MLERTVPIADDRQQTLAIFRVRKDANSLRHADRLAHRPASVNRAIVSEH
jgi:hypothetical protein